MVRQPASMQFRALTAAERFEALKNNEIDVLIRNTTWTQSRDTDIGMQFVATTYFDGQQMMGNPATLPGLTATSGFEAVDATQERFLRYGALWCGEDVPVPASLHNRRIIAYAMNRWTKLQPLHRWLVDTLQ